MVQNPEEGRLSPEQQAELLREARKRTVAMRREYRTMRREADAKAAVERWAARHRKGHQEAYDDLAKAAGFGKLNRRERRHFARRMNVFKTKEGWPLFMRNYAKTFDKSETVVSVKGRNKKTNIEQAMAESIAKKAGK